MIKQCTIIFSCLAVGELLTELFQLPLPGSLIGMVLLTTLLEMKIIKVEGIKQICNFLVDNMAFFFVPAGVGVILYLDLIQANIWAIAAISVITTLVVLFTVGKIFQKTESRKENKRC